MADLLTRIRAYVAQIPTHKCFMCESLINTEEGKACPVCDAPSEYLFALFEDTPADALLRKVAALEPAGYIWPDSVHVLKAHELRYEVLWAEPTGQAGLPLYALTGDSYDPE